MPRSTAFRFTAVLAAACIAASCATTRIPPISAEGAAFKPANDEQQLWQAARDEERKLLSKARTYNDPLLADYLEGVVARVNTAGMAANPQISYRVTVLEDPALNAFAYPTGSLFVHTGLLARMENEDQLATVLGHEMTHVENRHMLRYQRAARNRAIGWTIAAMAAAVVLAGEAADEAHEGNWGKAARIDVVSDILIGLGLQLAFLASVNGYGRDLEREADEGGMEKLAAAGYDPNEAPKVYEILQQDAGDAPKLEAFFFGSHPQLAQRIEATTAWASTHPRRIGEATIDKRDFERRMRPVIRDDARLNIAAGRLNLAQQQLDKVLAQMPEDPETHFLLGRLKLARADAEKDRSKTAALRDEARGPIEEAIRLDPERPEYRHELALLAYRDGDRALACEQFRYYLELDPKGEHAQAVRDYILELQRDGDCVSSENVPGS
ncbi:MAG: M48 family metalloprotease [Acidobacteria bacterium]|nr:M48 family metalloprotease [Acidobacteriota bacterium]